MISAATSGSQRRALDEYRPLGASGPRSGLPTAAISRPYTLSPFPPTTAHRPSAVRKVPVGTTPEMVEPLGSRSAPEYANSAVAASSMLNIDSVMEASITCPRPSGRSRSSNARATPNAAWRPASESPSEMLGRTGGRSS